MQMGHRDSNVVHNHYKALVLKSEAEKFWNLQPEQPSAGNLSQATMTELAKNQFNPSGSPSRTPPIQIWECNQTEYKMLCKGLPPPSESRSQSLVNGILLA